MKPAYLSLISTLSFVGLFAAGCADHIPEGNVKTLQSGVKLISQSSCVSDAEPKTALIASRIPEGVVVSVSGFVSCSADLESAWVGTPINNTYTLGFGEKSYKIFANSCECFRSFKYLITEPIEKHDIVYVFNGRQVMGHLEVP